MIDLHVHSRYSDEDGIEISKRFHLIAQHINNNKIIEKSIVI